MCCKKLRLKCLGKCLRNASELPPWFRVNSRPPAIEFQAAATPTPPRPQPHHRGHAYATAETPTGHRGHAHTLRRLAATPTPPRIPPRPTAATPTLPRGSTPGSAPGSAVPTGYLNELELNFSLVALDTCL